MSHNDVFLDELLERTLARYSAAEPRPGLEQRIFATLQGQQLESAPWWRWRWLPAAAAAVILIAAALVFTRREAVPPSPEALVARPPSAATPVAPVKLVPAPPTVASIPRRPTAQANVVAVLPRFEQFPRPGTLTEDERLLQQYLDRAPREVLLASVSKHEPLGDVRVPDVEVFPLEVKDLPERSGEAMEN